MAKIDANKNAAFSAAVLRLFTDRGLIGDKNISDEKVRDSERKKRLRAFHNTELMLKQYKSIVWMLECFPETIAEELEQPFENIDSMIERLDVEMSMGNRKLENKMESIKKTRLAVDRINDALTVLKRKPQDGERLYNLIYLTYITPENLNHNEILYRLNMSSRHYYRLREQAIGILFIRLWSAPDKELDFWLELMSALDAQ